MLKRSLFVSLLSLYLLNPNTSLASLPSVSQQPGGIMYFFEQNIPSTITTNKLSKLSLDNYIYKDGKSSLLWQYSPSAKLTFKNPIIVGNNQIKPANFVAWIYQEKPLSNQKIKFEFYRDGKVYKYFTFKLNFQGWHGFAIPYRDMPGEKVNANTKYDKLVITAPPVSGKLYFDQLMLNPAVDNRSSVPDNLLPFINPDSQTAANRRWNALYTYNKWLLQHQPSLKFNEPFIEGKTTPIYQKIDFYNNVKKDLKIKPEDIQAILNKFKSFNIKIHNQEISAPPLHYPTSLEIVKDPINTNPDISSELIKGNDLRTIGKTMLQAAKLLRSNNLTQTERNELTQNFLTTLRYIINQGFTYGSSYQILHHLGYQDRELFSSLFIARQILADNKMLEPAQKMMAWYSGTGRIFNPKVVDANVDILNTQLQWILESILLLPDQKQREEMLSQFTQWLNKTLLTKNGVSGGFKPDYTMFHHGQHYPAYGIDALKGLTPTMYMISQSPYALSKAAHQKLQNVLINLAFYTKETNIPIALSGRHPTETIKVDPNIYKWAALSGSPDNKSKIDPIIAGIYARLANIKNFEGIPASPEPIGFKAFNYSSLLAVRGANNEDRKKDKSWLLLARGFSRYLVGNEAYATNNLYSRYGLYGKLEFIPSNFNERSFRHDGFDWNHYDGTTAIVLPFDQLKAQLKQLPGAGLEEMLLSDQTYSGAVTLGNKAGLFAQKVHGAAKYNQQNFWANKSYFVVGNRIIALGSGINSTDQQHPVNTTLFQQFMFDKNKPVLFNSKKVLNNDKFSSSNNTVIISPNGVNYYIPKGQHIEITRSIQTTPDDRNSHATTNDFTLAILNQGIAPKNAHYEYSMIIEPTPNQPSPIYNVLENDNNVHSVRDGITGIESYAFFKASKVKSNNSLIIGANKPSMVLAQLKNQILTISAVNPDLNFYQGVEKDQIDKNGNQKEVSIYSRKWILNPSKPTITTYTIRGKYKLLKKLHNVKIIYKNDSTLVTITANNAATTELMLTAMH